MTAPLDSAADDADIETSISFVIFDSIESWGRVFAARGNDVDPFRLLIRATCDLWRDLSLGRQTNPEFFQYDKIAAGDALMEFAQASGIDTDRAQKYIAEVFSPHLRVVVAAYESAVEIKEPDEPLTSRADEKKAEQPDRSKKQQFTLYRDLATTSTKEWLVKNLLGHQEASASYGAPGSGKSVLVEDMGLHIAGGLQWHGREVRQGAVCYVALERRMLVERRAIAFRKHHAIQDLPFAIIGGVYDFRDPRTATTVAEIIEQVEHQTLQQTALIIIDTISRALAGGDENSPKDMGAIVATTARLQEATGAHVAWVHHVPINAGERLRGHGALLGALDTTINVEKLANGQRTATVIKANDSEEGQRITFTLKSVDIGIETTAPVVVQAEEQPRITSSEPRLTKNQQTMFSLLHAAGPGGLTTEQWNERARNEGVGVKRKADLYDIRAALKSKGIVRQYGDRWNVC